MLLNSPKHWKMFVNQGNKWSFERTSLYCWMHLCWNCAQSPVDDGVTLKNDFKIVVAVWRQSCTWCQRTKEVKHKQWSRHCAITWETKLVSRQKEWSSKQTVVDLIVFILRWNFKSWFICFFSEKRDGVRNILRTP